MFASNKTTRAARFAKAVLGAAAVACFATPAGAAEPRQEKKMPASYREYQEIQPMEAMKMMDADGNNVVTREEFMKFQEAVFERIDKNKDRRLQEADFTGAQGG